MKWQHAFVLVLCTAIVAVLGTSLYFKSQLGEHSSAAHALINKVTHGKVKVIKSFRTAGELQAFIVAEKSKPHARNIIYTDRTGRYLISGNIINSKGVNLTAKAYKKYIEPKTADAAFGKIAKTNWFLQGSPKAPHKLYVVADPNCLICHMFYEAIQPSIKAGQVAVRWLLVGLIKPSSPAKTITILANKNPIAAMAANEAGFNGKTEEGSTIPLKNPTVVQKNRLTTNNNFAKEFQIFQTPTIFYKTATGQTRMQAGFTKTKLALLINAAGAKF